MDIDATQAMDLGYDDENEESQTERKEVGKLKTIQHKYFPETEFTIYEGVNIIGRTDQADVAIKAKGLSKKHACIEVESDSYMIYDCGSVNKTKKGKILLKPFIRYELKDGDDITFADVQTYFFTSSKEDNDETGSITEGGSETGSESMIPEEEEEIIRNSPSNTSETFMGDKDKMITNNESDVVVFNNESSNNAEPGSSKPTVDGQYDEKEKLNNISAISNESDSILLPTQMEKSSVLGKSRTKDITVDELYAADTESESENTPEDRLQSKGVTVVGQTPGFLLSQHVKSKNVDKIPDSPVGESATSNNLLCESNLQSPGVTAIDETHDDIPSEWDNSAQYATTVPVEEDDSKEDECATDSEIVKALNIDVDKKHTEIDCEPNEEAIEEEASHNSTEEEQVKDISIVDDNNEGLENDADIAGTYVFEDFNYEGEDEDEDEDDEENIQRCGELELNENEDGEQKKQGVHTDAQVVSHNEESQEIPFGIAIPKCVTSTQLLESFQSFGTPTSSISDNLMAQKIPSVERKIEDRKIVYDSDEDATQPYETSSPYKHKSSEKETVFKVPLAASVKSSLPGGSMKLPGNDFYDAADAGTHMSSSDGDAPKNLMKNKEMSGNESESSYDAVDAETQMSGNDDKTSKEIKQNEDIDLDSLATQAYDNTATQAYDNITTQAYHNLDTEPVDDMATQAYDNMTTQAYGNMDIEPSDNMATQAYDNMTTQAYENMATQAYENIATQAYAAVDESMKGEDVQNLDTTLDYDPAKNECATQAYHNDEFTTLKYSNTENTDADEKDIESDNLIATQRYGDEAATQAYSIEESDSAGEHDISATQAYALDEQEETKAPSDYAGKVLEDSFKKSIEQDSEVTNQSAKIDTGEETSKQSNLKQIKRLRERSKKSVKFVVEKEDDENTKILQTKRNTRTRSTRGKNTKVQVDEDQVSAVEEQHAADNTHTEKHETKKINRKGKSKATLVQKSVVDGAIEMEPPDLYNDVSNDITNTVTLNSRRPKRKVNINTTANTCVTRGSETVNTKCPLEIDLTDSERNITEQPLSKKLNKQPPKSRTKKNATETNITLDNADAVNVSDRQETVENPNIMVSSKSKRSVRKKINNQSSDIVEKIEEDTSAKQTISRNKIKQDAESVKQDTSNIGQSTRGRKREKKEESNVDQGPSKKESTSTKKALGKISNESRRSSGLMKPKVVFTGISNKIVEKVVHNLGGEVVDNVEFATHLVTDKVRRTVKFLCAVGKGIPIITPDWLLSGKEIHTFTTCKDYMLVDEAAEKQYKFQLKRSLRKASESPLLKDYNIYVTKNVKPELKAMKEMISCSGGKFLNKLPRSPTNDVIVISCSEDEQEYKKLVDRGFTVCTNEVLLTGILKQEIDVKQFVISSEAETAHEEMTQERPSRKRQASQTTKTTSKRKR